MSFFTSKQHLLLSMVLAYVEISWTVLGVRTSVEFRFLMWSGVGSSVEFGWFGVDIGTGCEGGNF